MEMRIGIDFDNTIVCYDTVFYIAAREKNLIPESVSPTKSSVRDYLRSVDQEDDWTELQGYIYGTRMELAQPFPGVFDFMRRAIEANIGIFIVSHKTQHPYMGPRYDLHAAARGWLESQGVFDPGKIGLATEAAFFEPTKELKLSCIGALDCSHFIDDLPEFLDEPAFPQGVEKLLFEPGEERPVSTPMQRVTSWREIGALLLGEGMAAR
jgi:hypothetical protein